MIRFFGIKLRKLSKKTSLRKRRKSVEEEERSVSVEEEERSVSVEEEERSVSVRRIEECRGRREEWKWVKNPERRCRTKERKKKFNRMMNITKSSKQMKKRACRKYSA